MYKEKIIFAIIYGFSERQNKHKHYHLSTKNSDFWTKKNPFQNISFFLQWLEEPTAIPCINNKIHFKLLVNKWQLKWKKNWNANLNPQRAKTSTSYISKIFTVRSWKGLDRISNPVLGDSSYEKRDSSVTNGSLKSRKIIMSIQSEKEKTR